MTVAGELVKELLRMIEDENESGNLVEVRRSRAPWGDPTDLEVREILRLLSFGILWSSQKHF